LRADEGASTIFAGKSKTIFRIAKYPLGRIFLSLIINNNIS